MIIGLSLAKGKSLCTHNSITALFSEFVERNHLVDAYGKKIVPHGLRHNFATVGIRAGMDIASLALMMGHASRAMTLDTYGDANADALTLASVKLEDTFNKNTSFGEEQTQMPEEAEQREQNKGEG